MIVDLKMLITELSGAESSKLPIQEYPVTKYLLDNLMNPLITGKTMQLGDLDFSAFDLDDLEDLQEYLNENIRLNNALTGLNQFFYKAEPQAVARRSFC